MFVKLFYTFIFTLRPADANAAKRNNDAAYIKAAATKQNHILPQLLLLSVGALRVKRFG